MNTLLATIKTKLTDLLVGVTYPSPDGSVTAPGLYIGALPSKRSSVEQKHDFPFVVIRPLKGSESKRERTAQVRLICGMWEQDDIVAGVTAVHDLADHCLGLQLDKSFTPWVLTDEPVSWGSGDDREGNQPMPFYFLTIDFNFKHTPRTA